MPGTQYVVSINDLRTSAAAHITSPSANDIFYVNDANRQGAFYYDGSSGTDNTGTILVNTNSGVAFKRVLDDHINVKWFGAVGNGSTDDIIAIQAAVNASIAIAVKRVYFPVGNYRITKGIVVQAPSGFLEAMVIEGETGSYGAQQGQTVITLDNANSFALGLQLVKGAQVRNLTIHGNNTALLSLNQYQIQQDPSTNWTNGIRDNPYSPHAGIVIDPFSNSSMPNNDRYPDFTSYYTVPGNGGSTNVIIESCTVRYFAVNYCISPHGTPQNADAIRINNCWGDFCKVAITTGQSQTRSVYVNNFKCWGHTYAVFDSRTYGDGTGCPPEVNVLNVAGGVRYLCVIGGFFSKGLVIKNMHAELLYSLGGNFTSLTGDLVIEDSWVNLSGPLPAASHFGGTSIQQPITVFKGFSLKICNSTFFQYGASFLMPIQVSVRSAIFEKCYFNYIPYNSGNVTSDFTFRECSASGSDFTFGDHAIISGAQPAEIAASRILFGAGMQWTVNHVFGVPFKRVKVDDATNQFTKNVHYILFGQQITLTNVDNATLTAQFTITPSLDDFKKLQVADILMVLLTDEYGDNKWAVMGKITALNPGTGLVSIGGIAKGLAAAQYTIILYRNDYLIPPLVIGNITSGSNVVSSVLLEANSTNLLAGAPIKSKYFASGTYIVSYSAGTLTLSNNANATKSGVEILASDWQGMSWGYPQPLSVYKIGYKEGDIIYNTRQDLHPNVSFWICTKTGITNTAVIPEFEPVFKSTYNASYTSNRTADITDYGKVLFLDSTTAAVTLTVDPALFINRTLQLYAKKPGANAITITPSSGTINGSANYAMANQEGINIYSDGTNLFIIART